jgi:hypothetical protein
LTDAQRRAIQRLVSGESATAAAASAGVHRQTVHRWLRDDPAFRAAFHGWQVAATEHAKARLLALADAAVTTVANAVTSGDTRTALVILKAQGLLTPPTPGSTDPHHIARQQLTDAARAEAALAQDEAGTAPEILVPDKFRAHHAAHPRLPRQTPPPAEPAALAFTDDPAVDLINSLDDPMFAPPDDDLI